LTLIDCRSSGLGHATTKLLLERGANVAVLDLQEPPESHSSLKYWECDVSDDNLVESRVKEAIQWAEKENKPLGGAICCAGVAMAGRVISPAD
jgi:3-hydroxyacyl-CoA dehydrogenase / 3-hydroxy-2-methylbutyryl-CoA dehydrogenase